MPELSNQFEIRKEHFPYPSGGESQWHAYRGEHRVGSLIVEHKHERPSRTDMPQNYGGRSHDLNWWRGSVPGGYGQGKLFDMTPHRPEQHKIWSLFTTKQSRHTAPLLLGLAENVARTETGRGLVVPTDLSSHSARMVSNLKQRGALPETVSSEVENTHSWQDPYHVSPRLRGGEVVSPEEKSAARRTVRQVLRPSKPQEAVTGGEQMQLFTKRGDTWKQGALF